MNEVIIKLIKDNIARLELDLEPLEYKLKSGRNAIKGCEERLERLRTDEKERLKKIKVIKDSIVFFEEKVRYLEK